SCVAGWAIHPAISLTDRSNGLRGPGVLPAPAAWPARAPAIDAGTFSRVKHRVRATPFLLQSGPDDRLCLMGSRLRLVVPIVRLAPIAATARRQPRWLRGQFSLAGQERQGPPAERSVR